MTELHNNRIPNTLRTTTEELDRIPTLPEAPEDASLLTAEKKKSKKKLLYGAIAGTAITVMAATGAFIGGRAMAEGDTNGAGPEVAPVSTSEVVNEAEPEIIPTVAPAPESDVPTAETETTTEGTLEAIPAGLTADEFGKAYLQNVNAMTNNYSDQDQMVTDWMDSGLTMTEFYTQVSTEKANSFADVMFEEGWENTPGLVTLHNNMIEYGAYFTELNVATSGDTYPADIEPFYQSANLESTQEMLSDGETRGVRIYVNETNNADMNRVGEELVGESVDSNFMLTVIFKEVDGQVKITDWSSDRI